MRTLKNREKIIQTLNSLSIAIRNMKNDIRQERDFSETKDYMQELDYFQGLFSQLGNKNVLKRKCLGLR
jgi:AAA+ ATPase superfamily predicted ATPase